jgi:hypothetical protein
MRSALAAILLLALILGLSAGFEYDAANDVTIYRSPWGVRWIAEDGRSMRIAVLEGCGGWDRFDHAEFAEVGAGLRVTVFNRVPAHGDCTDEARTGFYTIRLPRPLGDGRITKGCWEGSTGPRCYRYREPK